MSEERDVLWWHRREWHDFGEVAGWTVRIRYRPDYFVIEAQAMKFPSAQPTRERRRGINAFGSSPEYLDEAIREWAGQLDAMI